MSNKKKNNNNVSSTNVVSETPLKSSDITSNFSNTNKNNAKTKTHYYDNKQNNVDSNVDNVNKDFKPTISTNSSSSDVAMSSTKYNRDVDSISDIATSIVHSPLDNVTGRIHQPLFTQTKIFDVCGFKGSILNMAFRDAIFELKQSPQWISNGNQINSRFSDDFLQTYFNYVGRMIAIRTILLNFVHLYDDHHKNNIFKNDKVLFGLFSPFFSAFVPRRKQFTSALETLETNLSEFYLPPFFVKEIEDMFKITSLPYHGYETLIFNSLLICLPESVFAKSGKSFDLSEKSDCIMNFPFDERITGDYSKVYPTLVNIVNYFNNVLTGSCSYYGEFNDVHSLFKIAISDWQVKVTSNEDYVYTKHMSDSERINLINSPTPSIDKVNSANIYYDHVIGDDLLPGKMSVLTKLVYSGNLTTPTILPFSSSVIIDEFKNSELVKPVFSREYDNFTLWHDSIGGFALTAEELRHFSLPFTINTEFSNTDLKITSINEPGFTTIATDSDGVALLYGFVNSLVANIGNAVNITALLNEQTIFNYFSSISRRSGHFYKVYGFTKGSTLTEFLAKNANNNDIVKDIEVKKLFLSHPTLRRVSLNFDLISSRLHSFYKKNWTSEVMVSLYNSKNTLDTRGDYRTIPVRVVNTINNTNNKNNNLTQ